MKIVDIKAHPLLIPFRQESIPTPGFTEGLTQVVVEVVTDQGLSGYGEAFGLGVPKGSAAVVEELFHPMLIGQDALDIPRLQEMMFQRSHIWGRYGVTTFALSGVEIALWDLAGRYAGLPLHRLLGGSTRRSLPAYASLINYPDPEQLDGMVAKAKDMGFKSFKIHQTELAAVAATREAVGESADLMVDVNSPWSPRRAAEMAEAMAEYDPTWLEEPIWPPEDYKSLAGLRGRGFVPLALGENACTAFQFKAMLDTGCADYVQPSVTKVGGIGEWLKVAHLAQSHNVPVVPHSFYFGQGYLATAQLLAVTPGALYIESFFAEPETTIYGVSLEAEQGFFTIPQGPGLGLEVNTDVLREYRLPE